MLANRYKPFKPASQYLMAHIQLKPSKEILIDFHPSELDDGNIPEESKQIARDYLKSRKLAEDDDYDIMLMFEGKVLYGFDYLYQSEKRMLVEVNPVTIFYSNAIMSFGALAHYKEVLLSQAPEVAKIGMENSSKPVSLTHTGMYFQFAINCIINLQASLESFANRIIPANFPFLDKNGNPADRNITYKLYNALPKVKNIDFTQKKNRKYNISIDRLIKLRNDVIHLKPSGVTNTGYKGVYRDLLDFDYDKAILSVRTFINFYEPDLIQECLCGKNFIFYSGELKKE